MEIRALHGWDIDYREAVAIQERLAGQLVERPLDIGRIRTVAGVDVSFDRGSPRVHCAVVVLDFETLAPVEQAGVSLEVPFPYIPGLLSYREGPAVVAAFEKLKAAPDAVIFDGQGIAHPRRMGIAAMLGLWLDLPSVGCAKSRLCGTHEEPGRSKGSRVPLLDGDEVIGSVLRTRDNIKPVYISRGHLCDLDSAVQLVLACTPKYRLPETTRRAHDLCNRIRRGEGFPTS
jgi:deoxyribonuclease V